MKLKVIITEEDVLEAAKDIGCDRLPPREMKKHLKSMGAPYEPGIWEVDHYLGHYPSSQGFTKVSDK